MVFRGRVSESGNDLDVCPWDGFDEVAEELAAECIWALGAAEKVGVRGDGREAVGIGCLSRGDDPMFG
ncbi:MAG: hypothetical protein JO152_14280, partial [Mycobacteriaceae bacterium]|nr:hypothetical protein [Mycobacteriaceae bacterium]